VPAVAVMAGAVLTVVGVLACSLLMLAVFEPALILGVRVQQGV